MLLFGGDIDVQHRDRLISLDGWIYFQVWEGFCICVLFGIDYQCMVSCLICIDRFIGKKKMVVKL